MQSVGVVPVKLSSWGRCLAQLTIEPCAIVMFGSSLVSGRFLVCEQRGERGREKKDEEEGEEEEEIPSDVTEPPLVPNVRGENEEDEEEGEGCKPRKNRRRRWFRLYAERRDSPIA